MSTTTIKQINGKPLFRSLIKVLVAGTAVDTSNTTGTQYTFSGGEYVEVQPVEGPCWIEVIASASMTASGAKAVLVEQGEKYLFRLKTGATKISADSPSGAIDVRVMEKQSD